MSLEAGTRLGPYEVTAQIGKGGMGEVYRARDTSLDRDVAIKVLPAEFASDPERLARFEREAKVLASLNHPNIAHIHGLERSGDAPALILELVEGPTLQDRIAQGAIPLDEALPIAKQIAEALEAAHEQGIIHRDLKPANIKVTPEGVVKVLDFGLAKALEPERSDDDIANSPTMAMTAGATKMGMIMGTAAYMSPEQAKGKPLDKRADIWAFGAVLYEILTGRRAFAGEDVSSILAKVIEGDPDWSQIPARTPPAIRTLVRRCLTKDAKRRIPDIGIAQIEIDEALSTPPGEAVPGAPFASPVSRVLPWTMAGVLAVTAVVAVTMAWTRAEPDELARPRPIRRFAITPAADRFPRMSLSPDGSRVVYSAPTPDGRGFVVRRLDEFEARPLTGAEGGRNSFFSPDGEWLGFSVGRQLKKVSVNGGTPVTLADLPRGTVFRRSWGTDGYIYFGGIDHGLWRVSDAGGEPEALTRPDAENGELDWHAPLVLPERDVVLFTLHDQNREFRIEALSLGTGERKVLIEDAFDVRYTPTGHIVYGRANELWAAPFDLARLDVTGPSVRVLENVFNVPKNGTAAFSVAADGTLAYIPAPSLNGRTLVWVDRDGTEEPLSTEPRAFAPPRLSPSGDRVAVPVTDGDSQDIWVYHLAEDTWRRVTFEGSNAGPAWTPDGTRVAFSSDRAGKSNIYWKPADGGGTAELLVATGLWTTPNSFTPDGITLALTEEEATERPHIRTLRVGGGGSPQPVLDANTLEGTDDAQLSPDGRFIAYRHRLGGQVHVRPFPDVDEGQWQISPDGGNSPVWAHGGRELFYRRGNAIIAVPIVTEPDFQYGPPRELFQSNLRGLDVAPDGRFLMMKPDEDELTSQPIHIVLNFFEELKARVPTGQ